LLSPHRMRYTKHGMTRLSSSRKACLLRSCKFFSKCKNI
jgi:hypothetical protein